MEFIFSKQEQLWETILLLLGKKLRPPPRASVQTRIQTGRFWDLAASRRLPERQAKLSPNLPSFGPELGWMEEPRVGAWPKDRLQSQVPLVGALLSSAGAIRRGLVEDVAVPGDKLASGDLND